MSSLSAVALSGLGGEEKKKNQIHSEEGFFNSLGKRQSGEQKKGAMKKRSPRSGL